MRFLCIILAIPLALSAQEKEKTNPLAGKPEAVAEGRELFRQSCAFCHGMDARGGARGPDLVTGRRTHGETDAQLFEVISRGVPGTEMPANEMPEEEVWAIVSWLRSVRAPSPPAAIGDRANGEKLFFGPAACAQCHMVNGRGGRLGPDLSRAGAARAPNYLAQSIRKAGADITWGFHTVTVVMPDGKRITGVRRNEDTFSIQLMDASERIHSYLKRNLKEVVQEERSLMPDYNERALSERDLQDLVAYLESLRGR